MPELFSLCDAPPAHLTPSWRSRLASSSEVYHVTTPASISMHKPGAQPRCASANGSGA